jgi:hypothetical protein
MSRLVLIGTTVGNGLIAARTMTGPNYLVVPALPHDQLVDILRKYGPVSPRSLARGRCAPGERALMRQGKPEPTVAGSDVEFPFR